MKLKKLEISGFKSFLDKSTISFPAGISAVVGPNGCGKSNILDALKWVMGEQSVKQLRGKSMEDIIFSGSRGKAPLNMAEVSLTLLNDNGSAPEELKDFSEIMITRRQYRSGERAYFLNKQPCRLKDIHNIFWGSGMGARSYAVIQQGNIGAITDAGPEERRAFIDEAAGVIRYKNRKNEALRKVHATNQNLLRVSDIIAEVKRQMDGLKRQAKKAERYKIFRDHMKELEVLTAVYYYDEYTGQIEETDRLLKELKDTNIGHEAQLNAIDAAIEKIKFERAQKSQEIASRKSRKFEVQRKTDKIENDLAYLKKDAETYKTEIVGLEEARIDLEKKNEQIGKEVVEVQDEINNLGSKIEQDKTILADENSSFEKIRDHLASMHQELEKEKKRLMNLVADEARYKNIYQNASNNKDNLSRRLKRMDEEELQAGQKVTELEKMEKEAVGELEKFRKEIGKLSENIREAEASLAEKNRALAAQIKQVQMLEIDQSKVKSRYSALVKMDKNFEWYKDGVRAIMKKDEAAEAVSDGAKPNGILGLTADIISPKAGYEVAVEAVLGESLQYIIVEDQQAGVNSIDYLQESGAGRSGFIPISTVKNLNGGSGKASGTDRHLLRYTNIKEGYETIAEALLGHVIVTETISDAISAWNSSNGAGPQTIVSKNGDMILHQGIMIGGSRDKLSGILAKKQEIKTLEKRIAELDQLLEKAGQEQKELESSLRKYEISLQKFIEEKNSAVRDETEAEKSLYKVSEDLKHAKRHLEIIRLEQEQILGEESDLDDEMARYNQSLARIEQEVKTAQDGVAELTEKIESVSQSLNEHNQRVMDIKLNLTSLQAKYDNSSHTLKRLKEFQDDGIRRYEQLSQEIDLKKKKKIGSMEEIEKYGQILPGMYEEYRALEKELEKNEADYKDIDEKLQESDNFISEIKNKREEIFEKTRYLELEQSQRRIKQENIAGRLEERYHHSLADFRLEMKEAFERNEMSIEEMETKLSGYREKIERIGDVNLGAINEYEELKARFEFLSTQQEDLVKALDDLQKVIRKINRITQDRFMQTFEKVNEKLEEVFPKLFNGGSAKLVLTEPDKPLETGVEFMIHPPGKKLTRLSLLSGGEKALSAIAFIFSIFLIKPAAFCLMDEIDAPLDEANVERFNELVKIIGDQSQIVMITHNKRTMEFADTLFGVTMEQKGISKIVSVNFDRAN
ncbi:MAG: chromosome segregation protein SMC [Desulfobacterales bacterium]